MCRNEWKCLFSNTSIHHLQYLAINGELRTSRFRSICWRRLLNILPSDSSTWLTTIQQSRSVYNLIKIKHHNDPHQEDCGPDDPLSQDDNVCFLLNSYLMHFFFMKKCYFDWFTYILSFLEYLESIFSRRRVKENY